MSGTRATSKWYAITLDRVLIALLLVTGFLFLSDQYDWFAFNERKGWTVLIAVAVVGGVLLLAGLWTIASWAASRWTSRKPFQFGLRSGVLVVAVVAIVCGWFGSAWKEAQTQREVLSEANAIVILNGPVGDGPTLLAVRAWLERLLGGDFFTDVTEVQVGIGDLSDVWVPVERPSANFESLMLLPKLKKVVLLNVQSPDRREVEALEARGIEVYSAMTW